MEKKQEEQARQMRELQEHVECLQRENDGLRAQVEKRHDLGEGDAQDSGQAKHSTVRDKGKKPIIPDDADAPTDDELSSRSSPNPSSVKRNRAKSRQRHSHRHVTNNIDSCDAPNSGVSLTTRQPVEFLWI